VSVTQMLHIAGWRFLSRGGKPVKTTAYTD